MLFVKVRSWLIDTTLGIPKLEAKSYLQLISAIYVGSCSQSDTQCYNNKNSNIGIEASGSSSHCYISSFI
jgi:hypothetical protein